MEKSWKRIIPMEDQSDSSSSDESQYLYNGNFWKRSVMSSRMKIPRLDGQGPSSQPGFSAVLVSAHPNPSDVLMHHDYVGSSRNNPNVNSTTLESSASFRNMESYFTKLRDLYRSRNTTVFNAHAPSTSNPLWFDNDTDPNREHDSSQELAVAVLAEMQLSAASHPTIIENRFNEENQETVQDISQLEHNDRNRMFCPTTPPLPPTEHPEAVPRESVLISPVKTEEQTPSSPLENVASTSNNVEVQNMPPKNTRITCVINKSEDTIQKQDGGLNEVLLGLLECPVCWEVMPPPIYQCLRGHLLCRPCRKRLSVCPTCRATLSASRNLAMEKVAEKLQYPCKNSGSGCTALVVLQDKREHEANCAHRLFPCLSPFCAPRWTCKLDTLVLHYEAMHSEMLRRGPKHILRIPVNHDFYRKVTSHVWVILAFEKLFTINLRIVPPGEVFGCVQYVGPYRMSRKFIYELKAQLPLEIYRCAKFERTTHSDQSNIDRLYLKKDCFHLSDNWTKNFKSDNSSRSMEYLEISATIRAS